MKLSAPNAPNLVKQWIAKAPHWLQVREVAFQNDVDLEPLHQGELETILLAEDLNADLVLLDEMIARQIVTQRGLQPVGTLVVLNLADERGLIDTTQAVEHLKQTSFRAAPRLYEWLIDEHNKRKR